MESRQRYRKHRQRQANPPQPLPYSHGSSRLFAKLFGEISALTGTIVSTPSGPPPTRNRSPAQLTSISCLFPPRGSVSSSCICLPSATRRPCSKASIHPAKPLSSTPGFCFFGPVPCKSTIPLVRSISLDLISRSPFTASHSSQPRQPHSHLLINHFELAPPQLHLANRQRNVFGIRRDALKHLPNLQFEQVPDLEPVQRNSCSHRYRQPRQHLPRRMFLNPRNPRNRRNAPDKL